MDPLSGLIPSKMTNFGSCDYIKENNSPNTLQRKGNKNLIMTNAKLETYM